MRFIRLFTLLFGLVLGNSLPAQREVAVIDYEVLADSLLADSQIQGLIDILDDRYESAFQKIMESFKANYAKAEKHYYCGTPDGLMEIRDELMLELETAKKYENTRLKMQAAVVTYSDSIVQQIVEIYTSLNESFLVVPKEHVLYQAEGVPDLSQWLIAFSRKEESIKEMIDFREVISKTLKILE